MLKNCRPFVICLFTGLILIPSMLHSQQNGPVSGVVLLDSDEPLAGATIFLNRIRKLQSDALGRINPVEAPFAIAITSASDGSFRADSLPIGDYAVCAAGPDQTHLRSCDWGGSSASVKITSDNPMPIVNLRIRRGALITIVVSDPKGLIEMVDPTGVNARETNLALGVISDLGYYPAKLVDHSGTQWKYVVAAPTGASARLLFDSVFSLVDQQGFQPQVGLPSLPIFVKSSNGVVLNLIAQ